MTGFSDDDAIPTWAKAYAAAGVAEGNRPGRVHSGRRRLPGGETPSPSTRTPRSSTARWTWRLWSCTCGIADREAVPSWAAQAVGNMEAASVLSAGSFGSDGWTAPSPGRTRHRCSPPPPAAGGRLLRPSGLAGLTGKYAQKGGRLRAALFLPPTLGKATDSHGLPLAVLAFFALYSHRRFVLN
jgi:hypothetical protein